MTRCGAFVASVASIFGLVVSAGNASASEEYTYPCIVPPYRGGPCADTIANVYQRAKPTSQSNYVVLLQKGEPVVLRCYSPGEVINGNNIWYYTSTDYDYPYSTTGWVTGAYLSTDRDPASGVGLC